MAENQQPAQRAVHKKIEPLIPGSGRTMLSAGVANQVIGAVNSFLGTTGKNGITVTIADANVVIELDAETRKKLAGVGGGGGSISWRGEWSAAATYDTDDIVIRSSTTNMESGEAATFICIADGTTGALNAPPSGETLTSTKWQTIARGHWRKIVCTSGTTKTTIDGGKVTVELDNASPSPTRVLIDVADIPGWAVGSQIRLREVRVCISGVEMKALSLMSDPVAV